MLQRFKARAELYEDLPQAVKPPMLLEIWGCLDLQTQHWECSHGVSS